MKRIYGFAAVALLAALTVTPLAFGQSSAAAQAARLKRLQDQQAAVLARVKAAQAASSAAAAQPTATPTVTPLPTPTAVPTAATTGTVAPKPSATAATSASAKPATSASAVPVTSATVSAAPVPVALALDIEALRKTRADRRHAEFTNLQARWGALLSDPRAADELKLHAQRSAYLQRIRALGSKDTAFVTGVDALITKEDTRDADAMNALRTGALPVAPAPAAAAVPAAGAAK